MRGEKILEIPYSLPIAVATLHGPKHLHLVPDAQIRKRIASFAGLHALHALDIELRIVPRADGLIRITGTLDATILPICVVSLEPFNEKMSAKIEAVFAPQALIKAMAKRIHDEKIENPDDLPDEIVDGMIDPAALAVEALILALDPYPKKPGIAFGGHEEEGGIASPFAALKALKLNPER